MKFPEPDYKTYAGPKTANTTCYESQAKTPLEEKERVEMHGYQTTQKPSSTATAETKPKTTHWLINPREQFNDG